jgi:hypothetical protein
MGARETKPARREHPAPAIPTIPITASPEYWSIIVSNIDHHDAMMLLAIMATCRAFVALGPVFLEAHQFRIINGPFEEKPKRLHGRAIHYCDDGTDPFRTIRIYKYGYLVEQIDFMYGALTQRRCWYRVKHRKTPQNNIILMFRYYRRGLQYVDYLISRDADDHDVELRCWRFVYKEHSDTWAADFDLWLQDSDQNDKWMRSIIDCVSEDAARDFVMEHLELLPPKWSG